MRIKTLSYNIHKGFSLYNIRYILHKIKALLKDFSPDIALLQEVLGDHKTPRKQIKNWDTNAQFEYLADSIWPHYTYGKNAVYNNGHHGNAILSKFPIVHDFNEDLTLHRFERRGLLHTKVYLPNQEYSFHALTTHINLREKDRYKQIDMILEYFQKNVSREDPLIFTGDFNDWRERISPILKKELHLEEAFLQDKNQHAKTFPSFFPLFCLDRIYYKNMNLVETSTFCPRTHRGLSDHLGILAEFEFKDLTQ